MVLLKRSFIQKYEMFSSLGMCIWYMYLRMPLFVTLGFLIIASPTHNNPGWILSNTGALYSVLFISENKWWIAWNCGRGFRYKGFGLPSRFSSIKTQKKKPIFDFSSISSSLFACWFSLSPSWRGGRRWEGGMIGRKWKSFVCKKDISFSFPLCFFLFLSFFLSPFALIDQLLLHVTFHNSNSWIC